MKMPQEVLNKVGLICLIALSGKVSSRIRLQKLVCLTNFEEEKSPFSFSFKSHYYGPYSEDLRGATDTLVGEGLLKESMNLLDGGKFSYSYRVTTAGLKYASEQISDPEIKEAMSPVAEIARRYKGMVTEEVVKKAKEASGLPSLR